MKILFLFLLNAILLTACTTIKAIRCGKPSYDTHRDFPTDTVFGNDTINTVLIETPAHDRYFEESKFFGRRLNGETVDDFFTHVRGKGALLIVRNDTILFEKYYGGFNPDTHSNIFSVSKAITSLLCGIAIDEGLIAISDPVTKYIPELVSADPLFKDLTIEHLLDMRTGLDFKEDYGWNPFSQTAGLYYGTDVVGQIKKLRFVDFPGTKHLYNSMATAILGVALERAVGIPFARYLEEKIWKPLDMETDAYVSLDDDNHRQAKAYGGIATNVRDLAKIGRLYLDDGIYDGKRIVSKSWIDRSTHASLENEAYSLCWNNIISRENGVDYVTPRFFAIGLFGQVLFCDPEQNLIFVTLGEKKGCEYHLLFDDFCRILSE